MRFARRSAALAVLLAGSAGAALLGAGPASAHVTVSAPGVTAGSSDAVITFRVPDESDKAATVGLALQLPTGTPIAGVLVAPKNGWTAKIVQKNLATPIKTDDGDISQVVSEIDWTAGPSAGIEPGFFGEFTIIAGKLPDGVSSLTFKAVQTYSDKSVVSWIEEPAPGSTAEPEHPAPTLTLTAAGNGSATASPSSSSSAGGTAASGGGAPSAAAATGTSSTASNGRANLGVGLGVVGILLGAAALAIAVVRGGRSRAGDSRPAESP